MKINIVKQSEVPEKFRLPYRTKYAEVYDSIIKAQKGDAVVIECETPKEAFKLSQAIFNKKSCDMKRGYGLLCGCSCTKSYNIVIINKN